MRYMNVLCALGFSSLVYGCAGQRDTTTHEIVDNLVQAGFPADDIMIVNGVVYVGRDAEVSLAASREMLESGSSKEEQYRTDNLISRSLSKICIDGSTFTGVFSTALDLAIQNYDEQPLTFAMARTPSAGCSFTINAVIAPGVVGGSSGFPSGGLPFGTINIGDGLSTFSVDTVEHVITHEIGHTIGFRHSDFFDRSISCGSGGNEGDGGVGAILIPGTPSGATVGGSIMNACFRTVETGEFTGTDLTGLLALYGLFSQFDDWARTPNVRAISGDFNGDGRTDIALVGGEGWFTVPVAFSNGDGTFTVTNTPVDSFPGSATAPGAQVVAGDVNGDGRADLIAAGGSGWFTIPVALSNGDGSFTTSNAANALFPGWATAPGAKLLAGDVDGDHRTDLILTGGAGWFTIPVAFSSGDGTFDVTNGAVDSFPGWAQTAGVKATAADVDGDGRADIVLVGGSGWFTVPMAISQGNGLFSVLNQADASIPVWSLDSSVRLLSGDANGDHRADILLTGGTAWTTIPAGFSNGNGTFTDTNAAVSDFPGWAQDSAARAVSGDFDGDGLTDLALVGGTGWWTAPVAFSNGNGTFRVSNLQLP